MSRILLVSTVTPQEEEEVALQCYQCGGFENVCSTPEDKGTVTTCPIDTKTCVVSRESKDLLRSSISMVSSLLCRWKRPQKM